MKGELVSARKAAIYSKGRTDDRRGAIRIKFRESGRGRQRESHPRQSVFYVNGHSRQEGLSPSRSLAVLCCFVVCPPYVMGHTHWQPAQRCHRCAVLAMAALLYFSPFAFSCRSHKYRICSLWSTMVNFCLSNFYIACSKSK